MLAIFIYVNGLNIDHLGQYESITRLPIIYTAFEARLYIHLIDSKESRENTVV